MNDNRPTGPNARSEPAALERLHGIADLLPAGASIPLTREALLEILETALEASTTPDEITAAELARRFQRSTSTVRGWLEAERFPGSSKLRGRDWRVPITAIEAFREQERGRKRVAGIDLGGWRKYVRDE